MLAKQNLQITIKEADLTVKLTISVKRNQMRNG